MGAGSRCGGRDEEAAWPSVLSLFLADEGGYTTVAMALALLLSLSLVFGLASVEWSSARAADVQEVADATALAGANVVSAYATVAQLVDACVLSLGLTGTMVCAAALVVAAIPPLQSYAPDLLDLGRNILSTRRSLARSASEGLSRLEGALPALVGLNSASCASANSEGSIEYLGMAVPLPLESRSDFSHLDDGLDAQELAERAEELRKASELKEESSKRADAARERAWRADNVDDPSCLRSRAESLAGLTPQQNPRYESSQGWSFEHARARAKSYYLRRWQAEPADGSTPDELQRSCARKAFYRFAYEEISSATCVDADVVDMSLPDLPHTTETVRASSLYTDQIWPCTMEGGRRVLHCSEGCPGATGVPAGLASLADIDSGAAERCEVCHMDASAMGNVADASTNISNGFEHYWHVIVDASREYQDAVEEGREAERRMRECAEKGADAFEKALEILSVERPKLQPPGCFGCVSVVRRAEAEVPSSLTATFLSPALLPAGYAISAATLAPDDASDGSNVLSSLVDGLRERGAGAGVSLVGDVGALWGRLLMGYGSAFESTAEVGSDFLDGVGSVFGEKVASWLRGRIDSVLEQTGLAPADLRLRKPVLVNSQQVLDRAGYDKASKAREFIESLPNDREGQVRACMDRVRQELGGLELTVAEIPIPWLEGQSIPLTITLGDLASP